MGLSRRALALTGARLVGDLGGTNLRLAVAVGGAYDEPRAYHTHELATLEAGIAHYLDALPATARPREAAIAVAGPVDGDLLRLTNLPWAFSIQALKTRFGFDRLLVVNDFAANALSLPFLGDGDLRPLGGMWQRPRRLAAPAALLGPGTGLGVSAFVPRAGGRPVTVAGEGGHVTMAPGNERESALLSWLRERFGHVSAERVLSGQGIENLYDALRAIDRLPAEPMAASAITAAAIAGGNAVAAEALDLFAALLGSVAGDLALTFGAKSGVYIAGGIVPALGQHFPSVSFRHRFENKGRFNAYLARIPSFVITHPYPALLGLARVRL